MGRDMQNGFETPRGESPSQAICCKNAMPMSHNLEHAQNENVERPLQDSCDFCMISDVAT